MVLYDSILHIFRDDLVHFIEFSQKMSYYRLYFRTDFFIEKIIMKRGETMEMLFVAVCQTEANSTPTPVPLQLLLPKLIIWHSRVTLIQNMAINSS